MPSHQQLQFAQHWPGGATPRNPPPDWPGGATPRNPPPDWPGGATPRNPPQRYASIHAWLISRDTDAEVRFLTTVLGAVETPGSRMLDRDGDIGHVVVEIDDMTIMLFDAKPPWPAIPAHLRVNVGDVAAAVERAAAAGARVVTRPTMLASGECVARVRDPQGHLWWLREQVEYVAPGELRSRFAEPAAQEAMAYVQRTLREELADAQRAPVSA